MYLAEKKSQAESQASVYPFKNNQMTLNIQQYKSRTIIFKTSGNVYKKSKVKVNRNESNKPSANATLVVPLNCDTDLPFNDLDYDPNPHTYPIFSKKISGDSSGEFSGYSGNSGNFVGFPDPLLWINAIDCVRFQGNSFKASSQIHVMQDFEIITINGHENAKMNSNFVCVYLINLQYSNEKKIVSICSSKECHSYSALNRQVLKRYPNSHP